MKSLDNQLTAKKRVLLGVLELLHNIPVEELVGTCSPTPALDHAYKSTCMRLRDEFDSLDLVYARYPGMTVVHLTKSASWMGQQAITLCSKIAELEKCESPSIYYMCPTCHTQALNLIK